MNNVRPLFPNTTDEEYEDLMLPHLNRAIGILWELAEQGKQEAAWEISTSLLRYAYHSMDTLNDIRRSGYFDDNKLPDLVAKAIDNLMADSAKAMGGDDSFADELRTRSPTKRSKQ